MRFGGLRIFLLLDQVDPAVHFATSVSVKREGTLEIDVLCHESSSPVFMHIAFSIQMAGSVSLRNDCV